MTSDGLDGVGLGAALCAVVIVGPAVFAAYWLTATSTWATGSAAAFGVVFVLRCLAGCADGQKRIIAVYRDGTSTAIR
jgi:hypothetical protein